MRLVSIFLRLTPLTQAHEPSDPPGSAVPLNLAACVYRWRPHIKPDFELQGDNVNHQQRAGQRIHSRPTPEQLQAFVASLSSGAPGDNPTVLISRIGNCDAITAAFNAFVTETSQTDEV